MYPPVSLWDWKVGPLFIHQDENCIESPESEVQLSAVVLIPPPQAANPELMLTIHSKHTFPWGPREKLFVLTWITAVRHGGLIGRKQPVWSKPKRYLFWDFWLRRRLFISTAKVEHRGFHNWTWHQDTDRPSWQVVVSLEGSEDGTSINNCANRGIYFMWPLKLYLRPEVKINHC